MPFLDLAAGAVFVDRKEFLLELLHIIIKDFDDNLGWQSDNAGDLPSFDPQLNRRHRSRGILDVMADRRSQFGPAGLLFKPRGPSVHKTLRFFPFDLRFGGAPIIFGSRAVWVAAPIDFVSAFLD
jgi:hypothetical protein